ncbi:MAG: NAD(P)-dependent oxidoreductase [Candidatus Marinimicrobia bacterium]|nr:NAD(P)-dependent oxidoreductase [Candidatus Neomarinimicrobiota bacterium]
MKKVLVTGACGYLGARLSKYLAENGFRITAFDSFDPSMYSQWTSLMEEVIIGDIRDETILYNLAKKQFDIVIHLISLDHNRSEDEPNFVSSINVMPTWNLLDKLSKNGLEKFIYFSTQQVLGKLPSTIIDESSPPNPINKYGLTHLLCEQIVNYYNEITETKCINIRLSNGYGSPVFKENNCWWLVINDFCKMANERGEIKLLSDGSPQRDFIHNLDISRAVGVLIKSKEDFIDNIFHIATGETWAILELAHIVADIYKGRYNKEIPIFLPDNSISESPELYQNEQRFNIDITKMKKLGFQPEISLQKGILELFEYLNSLYLDSSDIY